jgi:tRNA pseudouridine-54 N-methylase
MANIERQPCKYVSGSEISGVAAEHSVIAHISQSIARLQQLSQSDSDKGTEVSRSSGDLGESIVIDGANIESSQKFGDSNGAIVVNDSADLAHGSRPHFATLTKAAVAVTATSARASDAITIGDVPPREPMTKCDPEPSVFVAGVTGVGWSVVEASAGFKLAQYS